MTDTAPQTDVLVAHFAEKLAFETDVSDVYSAQAARVPFMLIDSRGDAAWAQGHIVGARHLPTGAIASRALTEVPLELPVVTYCWGPGCNGATRAALEFARLGYRVKEMIGGFEYWAREGYPVEDTRGTIARAADPLTAPIGAIACDC